MKILVKENNVIMDITETLNRQEETNYYLVNNDTLAIPEIFVENIYEVSEIPENVTPEKYCYSEEKGFYKNEDYVEYLTPEEEIARLKQNITELEMAITELYEGGIS